jgi:type I restriction enzyme R subunit
LKVDQYVEENKSDSWRGNRIKEKEVRIAIRKALEESNIKDESRVNAIFELVKNQNDY